jgi:hypothetical protein
MGTNVSTTFIQCPADAKKTLGIKLPFLVMIIKNVSMSYTPYALNTVLIFVVIYRLQFVAPQIFHFRGYGAG